MFGGHFCGKRDLKEVAPNDHPSTHALVFCTPTYIVHTHAYCAHPRVCHTPTCAHLRALRTHTLVMRTQNCMANIHVYCVHPRVMRTRTCIAHTHVLLIHPCVEQTHAYQYFALEKRAWRTFTRIMPSHTNCSLVHVL